MGLCDAARDLGTAYRAMPHTTGTGEMGQRRRRGRRASGGYPPAVPAATNSRASVFGRSTAWSAVLSAAVATALAGPVHTPAYADPVNVPSAGARPMPAGQLRLPGSTRPGTPVPGPPAPIVLGPLAQQIIAAETEAARLGEQLTGIDEQLGLARSRAAEAKMASDAAEAEVRRLQEKAAAEAAEAYKAATELEPYGSFGSDLGRLGSLMPGAGGLTADSEAAARELGHAQEEARTKYATYTAAVAVERDLTGQRTTVAASFTTRQAALVDLRRRNADQLARIEAEREAFEQAQASRYGHAGTNVHGERPHPNALKAVQFALAQLGKAYEWGAEGPDRYDCSGLAWAAYLPYTLLPRVAKDQFRATISVAYDKLLPGDLVFFATDQTDWTTIHHMGIYIGDDKMVHAPTTGDVVKISSVWRSRYFGATRVLPAVAAPPTTPPRPSPTPTPSRTPSPRPSPTSPSPSPTPTSPSPTPSPPPTESPSPTPSPTEPSSPSPSPSDSSSTEPSPSPEPSSSAGTTTSAPPDPTSSASAAP